MLSARLRRAAPWFHLLGWPILGLIAAARVVRHRRPWFLEFLDTWLMYLLAPFPLIGMLAAGLRSPGLALLAAVGSVLGLNWGRLALGRGPRCGTPTLRVLTANVLGTNPSAAGIVGLIERERPDVVALQEVRPELCAELVERVGHLLPYSRLEPHARFAGAALLSRWPLEDLDSFLFRDAGHWCQRARVMVEGRAVQLFNIHLDTPFEIYPRQGAPLPFGIRQRRNGARDREINELLGLIAEIDGPLIVLGDFNTPAGSRAHQQLLGDLRDAFQEAGRGLGHTFPQPISVHGLWLPCEVIRIDYAFFRGPLQPLTTRTLNQQGSDHRAVLTDFAFVEPAAAGTAPVPELATAVAAL
jgi:endonuclease/exonuclease/phosphatase (EEP) superfamily protein YafD